jgi:hypothetical protein
MKKSQTTRKAEIKGQKMVKTTIRVPEAVWKAAKIAGIKEECSVMDIVVRALQSYAVRGGR